MGLKVDPSPKGPITLEFELTFEDMVQSTLAAQRRSSEARYNLNFWRYWFPAVYVLTTFLAFAAGADFSRRETLANLLALVCVVTVALICWLVWTITSWGPKAAEEKVRRNEEYYRLFTGRRTVCATVDELVYGSDRSVLRLPWKAIQNVEETADWIFLCLIERSLVVPKRAFPDENAVRSFMEAVKFYRSA